MQNKTLERRHTGNLVEFHAIYDRMPFVRRCGVDEAYVLETEENRPQVREDF